ncbi:RNA polymerase sigma factor SigJ [Georgenia alba]|uniref:RNA polymerase sigma factor SigJ n=1 Tax=Georgenia alba TaxID=2233858 RepID=A0ABW2QC10_9MICO
MSAGSTGIDAEALARLRPLAFSVAYRMLGSVAEAEDVAQDALVRMFGAEGVANPKAYVTTVATRLSLDVLRSARVRRESYVGDWLPEPLLTEPGPARVSPTLAPGAHVELADDLSTAFLVLLETLTPTERAAFLLHDVLGFSHHETAEVVERSEVATRQLVSRARARIAERRPRFEDSPARRAELVERFLAACLEGRVEEFVDLLAEDVVFTGDGGGNVPPGFAITRPVRGREAVGRLLTGFVRRGLGLITVETCAVGGVPGAVWRSALDGGVLAVLSIDVVDGRITALGNVLNPDKLRHVGPLADLDALARAMQG